MQSLEGSAILFNPGPAEGLPKHVTKLQPLHLPFGVAGVGAEGGREGERDGGRERGKVRTCLERKEGGREAGREGGKEDTHGQCLSRPSGSAPA